MAQGKSLYRGVLTLLVLSIVSLAGFFLPGCDRSTTTYVEATGQTIYLDREGNYNIVRIGIHYDRMVTGRACLPGSPISAAYATSPKPPVFTNKLTALRVTGNVDFNDDFQAGEDWTSMFNVLQETSSFIQFPFDLTPWEGRLTLSLNHAPKGLIRVEFTVTSTFDNGLIVTTSSPTFIVTP